MRKSTGNKTALKPVMQKLHTLLQHKGATQEKLHKVMEPGSKTVFVFLAVYSGFMAAGILACL